MYWQLLLAAATLALVGAGAAWSASQIDRLRQRHRRSQRAERRIKRIGFQHAWGWVMGHNRVRRLTDQREPE